MFAKLLSRGFASSTETPPETHPSYFKALQSQYVEWRHNQNITAIIESFLRLSDKQLEMIGVQDRSDVHFLVLELMTKAEERLQIAEEVAAILDEKPQTAAMGEPTAAKEDADKKSAASVAA